MKACLDSVNIQEVGSTYSLGLDPRLFTEEENELHTGNSECIHCPSSLNCGGI